MLRRRLLIAATVVAVVANDLPLRMLSAGDWPWKDHYEGPETAVTQLAEQIDELERHIDTYGTIVAKSPDVWGQARLTKYRVEYEKVMEAEAKKFEATINAAISRSDQAFLLNALSLQAAVSESAPSGGVPAQPVERSVSRTETTFLQQDGQLFFDADGNPISAGTQNFATPAPSSPAAPPSIAVPTGPSFEQLTARPSFAATKVLREEELIGFGSGSIALEPTIKLDQMSRYLNHLHELRRISDGDDKSDAPGYALHLVRIPISVLPGSETREGYGAEVTVIARPNLHDELLPTTFRGLVINDLVDQLSFPLAKFLDNEKSGELLEKLATYLKAAPLLPTVKTASTDLKTELAALCGKNLEPQTVRAARCKLESLLDLAVTAGIMKTGEREQLLNGIPAAVINDASRVTINDLKWNDIRKKYAGPFAGLNALGLPDAAPRNEAQVDDVRQLLLQPLQGNIESAQTSLDKIIRAIENVVTDLDTLVASTDITVPAVAASPSRRSQQAFPPSHLLDVYGSLEFIIVAKLAEALKKDESNAKAVLLLDMQKFLAEEFHAAYDYLNKTPQLWQHCQQAIVNAVRGDDKHCLETLRNTFICSVMPPDVARTHTAAMAWMILVESALLNERLKQDIRELASAKNAYHLNVTNLDWINFSGPSEQLTPDARQLFNDYVTCRWPIHVVAVDPVTQDQNVADSFSQRREMQLALALGFASGRVGASNFTRMARRLELDMETIALNRTAVGFSHGDDTFGWRFYPRVQSPDTGGHLQTYAVDMFRGLSRDRTLKKSRLEPGIREVTAIVIMPSFVPYVIFDMRTNWFELVDPSEKVMTASDSMALSGQITSVRQLSANCARDAHLYRDGDVHRLLRAVDQLDRRLPMQTTYVQMPFENTLGGFEFFNTGVPDLAPELKGFYGEPGIRVKAAGSSAANNAAATAAALIAATATATATSPVNININGTPAAAAASSSPAAAAAAVAKSTIFLVGDHFSVHETRVIAGNKSIEGADMRLISRQVMEISIPETVTTVESGDRKFVDVHVATPYGLSNHLLIPVVDETGAVAAAVAKHEEEGHFDRFKWEPSEIEGCFSSIESNGFATLTLRGQPTLKFERQGDLPAFQPTHADVAFWIYVIDAAGSKKRLKKGTGAIRLGKFDAKGEVQIAVNQLQETVKAALDGESDRRPLGIAAIELAGFIRCREGDDVKPTDALPIMKTGNNIMIKIVPCGMNE